MHRFTAPAANNGLTASVAELPSTLAYALQPIVDIHSGAVYGYEALVRGTDAAGYASIDAFFDAAAAAERLWPVEQALHQLALATFRRLPNGFERRIFLNIDNRVFDDDAFSPETIAHTAQSLGVPAGQVTIELSEKHATANSSVELATRLRRAGLRIAIDDFGQGFSELKLLYDATPEYVKVDRFYVSGIAASPRKRLFLSTIVNLAHVLGASVVAEGVETKDELFICRDVGCDLVQGWLVARPLRDLTATPSVYLLPMQPLADIEGGPGPTVETTRYQRVPPAGCQTTTDELIGRFATDVNLEALPVVDASGAPLGLVTERSLRAELYARVIDAPAKQPATPIAEHVVKVPLIDVDSPIADLVERTDGLRNGVIVTRGGVYAGYLAPCKLGELINQRRLKLAQDQNPLSRLPGNASINGHLAWLGCQTGEHRVCCYFDFNHFKPFNDIYGFRQGDQAIVLFADILRRRLGPYAGFLGHIGGDDFFAAFVGVETVDIERSVDGVLGDFRSEVEVLYDADDRDNGFLMAEDRSGRPQIYPLLTCSAAVLSLPVGVPIETLDAFSRATALVKRAAKLAPSGRVSRVMDKVSTPR